ncbi:MAG: sterol desaturase family protein [Bacteroidetes bacterium]|nr:sterol desaturase family protein [Bacteroidota bacterium]
MTHEVFGIDHFDEKAVVAFLLLFGMAEALLGAYKNSRRTRHDYMTELVSFPQLTVLIQPGILLFVIFMGRKLFPEMEEQFASVAYGFQFLIFILIEDLPQYWWHRLAHHSPLLWKFHVAHHASPAMGVGVVFRNAFLYYLLMPNIWFASIAVFLGFGKVYLVYTVLKLLIIIGSHSELRWDSFLYRYKILSPLAWLVEHTISTPATHFAHHGISNDDGISNNNGNFGNMLFIWDQIFGTAKFTRKYPTEFGIENDPKDAWYVQLYYPLLKSKKKDSALK